jgi:hypothetical protein
MFFLVGNQAQHTLRFCCIPFDRSWMLQQWMYVILNMTLRHSRHFLCLETEKEERPK